MCRNIILLLWLCNLLGCFYSDNVNSFESCHRDYDLLTFCESPCVVQVGLSVVRVTFNKFIVETECVKEASIVYWISNETESSAKEMILNNYEKIYPKDCTYHRNRQPYSTIRKKFRNNNITETGKRQETTFEQPVQNDNRYVYLSGLNSGENYSIKTKVIINKRIKEKSMFSSLTTKISLSMDELFSSDGLVGHVNQGRCCDLRNFTYEIEPQSGDCSFQMPFTEAQTSISTFVMTILILITACLLALCLISKFCTTLRQRSGVQINTYQTPPEASFQYLDPKEIYQDLSTTRPQFHLNKKLLRSPTVAIRLPPEGEEIEFEELNKKIKCQSI